MQGPLFVKNWNYNDRFPLVLLILIAIYTKCVTVSSHRILYPSKTGISQIALIIIPQVGIEGDSYVELGESFFPNYNQK